MTNLLELEFEVINSLSAWQARASEIRGLLKTSNFHNPFSSQAWLEAWWKAYGKDYELCLGLFRMQGELVGFAPLMRSTRKVLGLFKLSTLSLIGEGLSDYADIIAQNDAPEIKKQILRLILEHWEWDEIHLQNIRETSDTCPLLQQAASSRHYSAFKTLVRCPYLCLRETCGQSYNSTFSKKQRNLFSNRFRHLDMLGVWGIQFNPEMSPDALFEKFAQLHIRRSAEKNWFPLYGQPEFKQFFLEIFSSLQHDFEIAYSVIVADGEIVSYRLGFVQNNIYYSWNGTFKEGFEKCSPGVLHYSLLIAECFNRKYHELDFLRGDSNHKMLFARGVRNNLRVRVLKKGRLLRPVRRLLWMKEREPGTLEDKLILALKSPLRLAKKILGK